MVQIYLYRKLKLTKNDEFAAVTVPCGFTKAGFNFANLSMGDTLIPLSFSIIFEVFGTK